MRPATNRRARQSAIGRTIQDADPSVSRILATYFAATPSERADGLTWYERANDTARRFADTYGVTLRQSAGVIAALSPQIGWAQNLQMAESVLQGGEPTHYLDCSTKALRIFAEPETDPLDILGGRKVRSFYNNIREPEAPGPVTVDRHALSLAVPDASDRYLERIGAYQYVAGAYRTAARSVGLLPHELQAVCWLTHRRLIGVSDHHNPPAEVF